MLEEVEKIVFMQSSQRNILSTFRHRRGVSVLHARTQSLQVSVTCQGKQHELSIFESGALTKGAFVSRPRVLGQTSSNWCKKEGSLGHLV